MLSELDMNEMAMVSGGSINGWNDPSNLSAGGGMDEIVVTGTRFTGSGMTNLPSEFDAGTNSLIGRVTNELIYQGHYDPSANLRDQLSALREHSERLEEQLRALQNHSHPHTHNHTHAPSNPVESLTEGGAGHTHPHHNNN